jgi:branched-subunit amino acid aminotransferase/4-amino-4-deoxychorismate lyase
MTTLSTWKLSSGSAGADLEPVVLPTEAQSLDEVSACLPGGAYTTLRTYHGNRALRFRDHVRRLEETSQLAGRFVKLDESSLRLALRRLLMNRPQGQDWRIRLTLDLEHAPGDLYITLEPLAVPPPEAYQQGVRVITCDLQRQLPKAKLTRFIERAAPLRRSLPPDVNEAIMLDAQGRLLEGLSSNFFAVIDGVVWTAEEGVLSGVTRGLVLDCARQIGQPVRLDAPRYADLSRFGEAFITSSSRGVLPVCQVDQIVVGPVCPGPVTRALMDAFSSAIEKLTEPI